MIDADDFVSEVLETKDADQLTRRERLILFCNQLEKIIDAAPDAPAAHKQNCNRFREWVKNGNDTEIARFGVFLESYMLPAWWDVLNIWGRHPAYAKVLKQPNIHLDNEHGKHRDSFMEAYRTPFVATFIATAGTADFDKMVAFCRFESFDKPVFKLTDFIATYAAENYPLQNGVAS